ncbi:MAG: hypothetical protein IJV69_03115 [Kiritimatiellae bacterium]|nr:hypothetical protein [Kiritimatiellia bacterium]
MQKWFTLIAVCFGLSSMVMAARFDLSQAAWKVRLEDASEFSIRLPGTLADAHLGEPAQKAEYGALTLKHRYIGKAVYTTSITVPEEEQGQYELFLERVLWKSTVALDGQEVGSCDSLATPHRYRLPLTPGRHTLSVTVDNTMIHPIGEKAHSYGDSMQTRWNGLLGTLELRPYNPLESVRIDAPFGETFTVTLPDVVPGVTAATVQLAVKERPVTILSRDGRTITASIPGAQAWSPESPTLYTLTLTVMPCGAVAPCAQADCVHYSHTLRFGFRTFSREGNRLFVNGTPLFIRGNLENCHFPLTGYPVMDKAGWLKILKAQQDQGANQIRFHTWCPPKAAFDAADELGLLLSPEAGIWIDGWMTGQFPYLKGLGKGAESVDRFVQEELRRILDAYGNAPSFFSLSIGNELGSSDFVQLGQWMAACKAYDGRHLYAASTARQITKSDDFIVTHAYPGLGMIRERLHPGTNWDYESSYQKTALPTIAHEIGQWPVYPDFDREIPKYTGILRPWNLEILRQQSVDAGVMRFVPAWSRASLKTNRLMYKAEIESFLRTPSCAGVSLLGIQDYSGQGEALIGWLDSFYDVKPGAETMVPSSVFLAPTVPLARFQKDTWQQHEVLRVTLFVHHYGEKPFNGVLPWQFADQQGEVTCSVAPGELREVAVLELPLQKVAAPARHTFSFGANRWSIWVYPQTIDDTVPASIVMTDDYDTALAALKAGRKVLLDASMSGNPARTLPSAFKPVYWSTTWFPGQRALALGLLIQDQSTAFKSFPTEDWQDWQWYHLVNSAKAFRLEACSETFTPLVMPIVDFHKPALAGLIFEVRYGEGRLLVSGIDLTSTRPEAKQLRRSLMDYVASEAFNPTESVTEKWLADTLMPPKRIAPPRPEAFKQATVYVECAAFRDPQASDRPWSKRLDHADLQAGSYELTGKNVRTWADKAGKYWVADEMTLTFKGTPNILGKLLIRFRDPDSKGARTAEGTFDGARTFTVPPHGVTAANPDGSAWITLPVDMEDFLDGELVLTIRRKTGNIMIDRVVLMPNAE